MKRLVLLVILIFSVAIIANAETEKKTKSAKEYVDDLSTEKNAKDIIEAAEWVRKEKKKDAVPKLIDLLDDEREDVRLSAVVALGEIGDESAVSAINNLLVNDESSDVRYAAVLASVRIGSKDSIDAWKEAKEKETDPIILDFLKKMEAKARKKK